MSQARLLQLLQQKRGYFEALLDLSEEEASLPTQEWVSVLEQKKILLSCIEELDDQLSPFRQKLHTLTEEMHEELEQMKQLVKKILFLDTQNQNARKHLFMKTDEKP